MTRAMSENRTHPLSWLRCNVKISTQFHTTHMFPVSVSPNVNTPLELHCRYVLRDRLQFSQTLITYTFFLFLAKIENLFRLAKLVYRNPNRTIICNYSPVHHVCRVSRKLRRIDVQHDIQSQLFILQRPFLFNQQFITI